MKVIFMGTPDFAAGVLNYIVEKGHNVVSVVTVPDRAAGRGLKLIPSAVKKSTLQHNIPILQPEKLRDEQFIKSLTELNADVFVVVAFRMLPEVVWSIPPKGTFNLHASLLPQYRGAAPINHAIINGEKISGVTTFFINHEIDKGDIIDAIELPIADDDSAGTYHDKLMDIGSELVHRTLENIKIGNISLKSQEKYRDEDLKLAPKIFKEDCRINLNQKAEEVRNFVRGMSPYPAAFIELLDEEGNELYMKIFELEIKNDKTSSNDAIVQTDEKSYLKIKCQDAWLYILDLQVFGKRRMKVDDYLRGAKDIIKFRYVK